MSELLTITETAERLHVTAGTVRSWINAYGLPVHGVSKKSRYCDWEEVVEWVKLRGAGRLRRAVVSQPRPTGKVVIDLSEHR